VKLSYRLDRGPTMRWAVGLTALSLLAGACGNSKDPKAKAKVVKDAKTVESGLDTAGKPTRGGRIVYGLEAESDGGYCLPESRLAASGYLVSKALYDTLTVLNDKAEVKPFLAKSVTPNDTYTKWTIVLRPNIKFSDGSALTATVVKNNYDALLGRFPPRKPTLTPLVLSNIDTITATDDLTVVMTTKTPWVALPSYMTAFGIMGQSQLDDPDNCDTKMVGTGPFQLSKWTPNQELLAQRNPHYWQIAPDGKPYPYADAIAFRPITDSQQRINALEAGEINVLQTSYPTDIYGALTDLKDAGKVNMLISNDHAEVGHLMLNNSKAPFDDERMRRALAQGFDRKTYNEIINNGISTIANQPFPPGDMGYVDDPGYPTFDLEAAKKLVAEYVADGHDATFTLNASSEPTILARAEVMQNMFSKIGISVKIHSVDQATLINEAIAGDFQAVIWRAHAGGEPDAQYLWWHSAPNPTNFARINDPVIDKALEEGRAEPDPAKRRVLYESISRRFAEKVYDIWITYSEWAIALSPHVHGVLSVELPDKGGKPFTGLATGHPVYGMWVTPD
jgi:peptide/nickel transport system substrate-binding protein